MLVYPKFICVEFYYTTSITVNTLFQMLISGKIANILKPHKDINILIL